jgi:phage-related protein
MNMKSIHQPEILQDEETGMSLNANKSNGTGESTDDVPVFLTADTSGDVRLPPQPLYAAAQSSFSAHADVSSKYEGNTGATTTFSFTVTRNSTTTNAEDIAWSVESGPTITADDFVQTNGQLPSGVLHFGQGDTSKTITVGVKGDTTVEGDETFSVVLGTAQTSQSLITESASGGYGTTNNYYTIGAAGGTLSVNYEMYSIPDTANVYVNGNRVRSTNQAVSGSGTLSWTGLHPNDSVRVEMIGTDTGTAWDYSISYSAGLAKITRADATILNDDTTASVNHAPTVSSSIYSQTATEGQAFSYQLPANLFSDADGDSLTYSASQSNGNALPSWLAFSTGSRTFSGTPTTGSSDLTLRVSVDDGHGGTASTSFALSTPAAAAVNHAPAVTSSIANQSTTEGRSYSYQVPLGLFTDADGDSLTYTTTQTSGFALPSWLAFDASTRSLSGTAPTGAADLNLRILVDDGHGGNASTDFSLATPAAAVVNHAPTVTSSIANQSVTEGQTYSYQLPFGLFNDADGDSLTYTATQTNGSALPYWLAFNANSQSLSGTAPTGAADLNVRIIVDDSHGGAASTDFALATPALTLVNHAPTVAGTIALQSATEGQAYSYQLPFGLFADADGDTLTYSATQSNGSTLPYWLSFNAGTKGFSGTPPGGTADLGLRVIVDDGHGGAVSTDFALATPAAAGGTTTGGTTGSTTGGSTGGNRAPVATGDMPEQTLFADTAFKYVMPASTFHDADGDKLTYTATLDDGSRLPSWLKFKSSTRTFSGTAPSDAGDMTVLVTARDPSGETAEAYLPLSMDNTDTGEMKYTFEAGISNGKGDYDYYYGYTFDNGSRDYFVGQTIDGTDKKGNYSWYFINGEETASRDGAKDGNVYVESYFDSETGITYTPKLFHAGKPSGIGQGLGFESDTIVSGTKSSKFGGAGYGVPFLEADLKISSSLVVFPS